MWSVNCVEIGFREAGPFWRVQVLNTDGCWLGILGFNWLGWVEESEEFSPLLQSRLEFRMGCCERFHFWEGCW